MEIEISDDTKQMLDDFRKELCLNISQLNDIELMKSIEKTSYSNLIQLLNFGFDERLMFDSCCGNFKVSAQPFDLTDEGRKFLLKVLHGE